MSDWFTYWNEQPRMFDPEPLRQVGKTVNGIPISADQFRAIVQDVRVKLALHPDDVLLDVCCGNGMLTFELAQHCRQVLGVDFSLPLIQSARERFGSERIEYILADACDLPTSVTGRAYSKVCMYEGLQHLSPEQANLFLAGLARIRAPRPMLFFGSVPDKERIWNFYDTPQRRAEYEQRRAEGTEAIGYWWTRTELSDLVRGFGYEAEFTALDSICHGAHYRMDALCRPI